MIDQGARTVVAPNNLTSVDVADGAVDKPISRFNETLEVAPPRLIRQRIARERLVKLSNATIGEAVCWNEVRDGGSEAGELPRAKSLVEDLLDQYLARRH